MRTNCWLRRDFVSWGIVRVSFLLLAMMTWGQASDAELAQAWSLTRENEMEAAKRLFVAVEQNPEADQEDRIQALYAQAYCWNYAQKGNNSQSALALYRQIIDSAPAGHPLIAWSDFEAAQAQYLSIPYEERDYAAFADSFMEVYRRHPQSPAGEEAYLTSLNLAKIAPAPDWPKLIKQGSAFVREHPQSPWVPQVWALMGEAYRNMGDVSRQIECAIRSLELIQQGADSLRADHSTALWNIAYVAEWELGDFKLARKYYHMLIEQYPRDNRGFLAQKALSRMDAVEQSLRKDGRFPPELVEEPTK